MNPDDILELIRARGRDPRLQVRPDVNKGAGQELSTEKLTALRQWVAAKRAEGVSDADLDQAIQTKYRKTLDHVMTPTTGDFQRAAISGATFGFNDELAGLGAALVPGGQGYSDVRDIVRGNAAGARIAAPKTMLATEIAGGLAPALLTLGAGTTAQGLSGGERALRAAEVGGALGAIGGLGHSEGETIGEIAGDVGDSFAMGTGLGLLGSGLGSAVRGVRAKFSPEQAVMREVDALLPATVGQSIARQEALAPGTATLGDFVPGMSRLVGKSREAGRTAVDQTAERVRALDRARQSVGQRYQAIEQKLPVDDELRSVVGKRLDLGDEVDFKAVHGLRSEIGRRLNDAKKAYQLRQEQGDVIAELSPIKEGLDNWLRTRLPEVAKIDEDYSAIMGMLQKARVVEKTARRSVESHGVMRAGGDVAASLGGSLTRRPSIGDMIAKVIAPNPERRAEVVQKLLLDPRGTRRAMSILAPQPSPFDELLSRSLLFGAAPNVPSLIGQ